MSYAILIKTEVSQLAYNLIIFPCVCEDGHDIKCVEIHARIRTENKVRKK